MEQVRSAFRDVALAKVVCRTDVNGSLEDGRELLAVGTARSLSMKEALLPTSLSDCPVDRGRLRLSFSGRIDSVMPAASSQCAHNPRYVK